MQEFNNNSAVSPEREEFKRNLNKIIDANFSSNQAEQLKIFAQHYYKLVAIEDLQKRNIDDLYGAVLSHWNFLSASDSEKTYVKVYNPEFEKHGWRSAHTIIEIVHPDLPFLVDSVSRAISFLNLTNHLMITPGSVKVTRDKNNQITDIKLPDYSKNTTSDYDSIIYIEVDKQDNKKDLRKIEGYIQEVLSDVRVVVHDWQKMRDQASAIKLELDQANNKYNHDEVKEATDFIQWLAEDHFTFLGCCDYVFVKDATSNSETLQLIEQSGYGILSQASRFKLEQCFAGLPSDAKFFTTRDELIVITKSNMLSTVHRSSHLDYIAVKLFGPDGDILGERRFLGLYTAVTYNSSIRSIPFLRRKANIIFEKANLSLNTHAGKNLLYILETLPRDDLFQASEQEILDIAIGILHMQERKQVRLFMRKDIFDRFYSCLVYLPREIFNSRKRKEIGDILLKELEGHELSFMVYFPESILTRIHFIVRLPLDKKLDTKVSLKEIENKIIECCKGWKEELHQALIDDLGEEQANILFARYSDAFPASYSELYNARKAVFDIVHIEKVINGSEIAMSLYRPLEEEQKKVRLKLFNHYKPLPLSEVLPVLENMGMHVQSENSNCITLNNRVTETIAGSHVLDQAAVDSCYINDFLMEHVSGEIVLVEKISENFQEGFLKVWNMEAENDKFNQLIIDANLSWREAAILRAYCKYFRQIGFTFSEIYIQDTVLKNKDVAQDLIALFKARFCPSIDRSTAAATMAEQEIKTRILEALDKITNLDEDRILRRFLDVILATLRTNFFQLDLSGKSKNYISFKFDPKLIPELVLPLPMFEIFVYSPRVEGIHLRGSKVARGGLRWSDRREDFRTEVLGLMKAQQVKNAVIVPAGAKGGFVCKQLPLNATREEISQEVIACYTTFIRALLDVTDNIVNDQIVPPTNVVRLDDDDTYLVVAADKGTASFSDIANNVSNEYGFWLGDAFASGGSYGYDHKGMGITARGAFESVKRHFHKYGINTSTTDFTAVGIGDMSGDVFGNGMLLSRHMRVVAAFNHQHIFIDPNPEAESSFKERERLFNLPRSTWLDYDTKLISKGGGVYSRNVKAIKLTAEAKEALGIDKDGENIMPNDLIKHILKAPVDLLWNGGIGTYVKSVSETDLQVGDRSNDAVRINGKDLRCRVVGEGGNLGFTQLGRVEAALNGISLFTDFIDNSGGVNCSDIEVNIKILLNPMIREGDLTFKQRNVLLEQMTDEVAQLVLKNNHNQGYAINLAASRAAKTIEEYAKFITGLEREGLLNREIEFLPNDEQILERKAKKLGLTTPEIAILMSYSKIILKRELLNSDVLDDPNVEYALASAFPKVLQEKYGKNLLSHRLKREIIATQLSNEIINDMGLTYTKRLFDETGANTAEIVKAHIIAQNILDKSVILGQLLGHSEKIDAEVLMKVLFEYIRLIRRSTRWLLRNHRTGLNIKTHLEHYKPLVHDLWMMLPDITSAHEKERCDKLKAQYIEAGMDSTIAARMGYIKQLYSAMDVTYIAAGNQDYNLEKIADLYYKIGEVLNLNTFRDQINSNPVDDNWDALARAASRDDVDYYQREITIGILQAKDLAPDLEQRIIKWQETFLSLISRWNLMLVELKTTKSKEFTIFSVALRELIDIAQSTKNYLNSESGSNIFPPQ